jgi:hypothetical protein
MALFGSFEFGAGEIGTVGSSAPIDHLAVSLSEAAVIRALLPASDTLDVALTESATQSTAAAPGEVRLTQISREAVMQPASPPALLTQISREGIAKPASPPALLTQISREVVVANKRPNNYIVGGAAPNIYSFVY